MSDPDYRTSVAASETERGSEGADTGDMFYAVVGGRVADARRRLDLKQTEVGDAVGLTRSSIANLERGRQRIPAHTLMQLVELLGFEVPELRSGQHQDRLLQLLRTTLAQRDRYRAALESVGRATRAALAQDSGGES